MTLQFKYLWGGNMATFDGAYTITDKTVWQHSRVIKEQHEAAHNGTTIGYYPTRWAAIGACEQHHQEQQ